MNSNFANIIKAIEKQIINHPNTKYSQHEHDMRKRALKNMLHEITPKLNDDYKVIRGVPKYTGNGENLLYRLTVIIELLNNLETIDLSINYVEEDDR